MYEFIVTRKNGIYRELHYINIFNGMCLVLNTLGTRLNVCYFPDGIFKRIFLSENVRNSINISQQFVHYSPIVCKSALVDIMAWHRAGDKPSSESAMA